ncbi:MAG: radical SAM protein, partial [Patescibacteria group bacterium]
TIVGAGLPALTYGVIVGLPDDSHETLTELEGAIKGLCESLKTMSPKLRFVVVPYAIRPLPGTPMSREIQSQGLMRFEDTAIVGGFWTACANTLHINYEKVSDWQERLMAIGDPMTQW